MTATTLNPASNPSNASNASNVVVIGAGAAGLMAAIFAARAGARVIAFDGAAKIGAKILVSGGGRCNVTHDVVHPEDFNGSSRNLIARVLRSFTVDETVAFFRELGVELKREETGKLFPVTDRARTVLDALLRAASEAGAEIVSGTRVQSIATGGHPSGCREAFVVETTHGTFRADRVVIATGGRSLPKSGSDGFGLELVKRLGHTATATTPALVPLLLPKDHWATALSGIAADVELTLAEPSGKVIHRESGAMLFTHFGLSGPVVLDISRHWIAHRGALLTANLLPGQTFDAVDARLLDATKKRPRIGVAAWLGERLPDRLATAVAGQVLENPAQPLVQLRKDDRRALARLLTALPLPVTGDRGYDFAEVTAGGVPLTEVSTATMESRLLPGLYLCGEILDVDGRIGGYNFQWAWASGRLAGLSAAKKPIADAARIEN